MRESGGWHNWSMILLETRSCESALQATKIEREFIEQFNATLNQRIPSRTKKEYSSDNRDHIQAKHKQYYEENKELVLERCKQYRENHKEEIKERKKQYQQDHREEIKEKKKQYQESHKDEIQEKRKQYRADHREEISEKRKQVITCCICKVQHRLNDKARHIRSLKHQSFLSQANSEVV